MRQEMQIKPELLKWARKRAGIHIDDLRKPFPNIELWELGEAYPTLNQLEDFAKKVHVPIGYLFLDEPPKEDLPIKDFRTLGSHVKRELSVNARDMIYICQRRQDWYRDYVRFNEIGEVGFAGKYSIKFDAQTAAKEIRKCLELNLQEQFKLPDKEAFLRLLRKKAEGGGILIMLSGIVGADTHRALDIEEFRGFALADSYAPLIFINGKDCVAGKIFTFAHELAHICLGESGISDTQPENHIEQWCNAFAAEFLVPAETLRQRVQCYDVRGDTKTVANLFKVSEAVIMRRLFELKILRKAAFNKYMAAAKRRDEAENTKKKPTGGGNYLKNLPVQIGRNFLVALYGSTQEGRTLYRDALRMVGTSKIETFKKVIFDIQEHKDAGSVSE